MRIATLVFLIDRKKNLICLGMKKRGFGASRWNGFGGKVKDEEIEDAAIREVFEETSNQESDSGIVISRENLNKVALLNFTFPHQPEYDQQVHVYLVETWSGRLDESEEMRPEWYEIDKIPYSQMWSDDICWLPNVLNGERITADFTFNEKDEIIDSKFREFSIP